MSKKVGRTSIIHPSFYRYGETILTGGEKADVLTQYSTRTGEVIRKHTLGFGSPSVIGVHEESKSVIVPVGASGRLAVLKSQDPCVDFY